MNPFFLWKGRLGRQGQSDLDYFDNSFCHGAGFKCLPGAPHTDMNVGLGMCSRMSAYVLIATSASGFGSHFRNSIPFPSKRRTRQEVLVRLNSGTTIQSDECAVILTSNAAGP